MNKTIPSLWAAKDTVALPSQVKLPSEIVSYAIQLSGKDKKQIVSGFQSESYEMTLNYVWTRSMATLKKELASVGMGFLGEILGKGDLDDDSNPASVISDSEAIMLAEELGVVTSTEAMRLRHCHELISHFVHDQAGEDVEVGLEEGEAIQALKVCVRNVLGKNKVEVSTKFAYFRSALESKIFKAEDDEIQQLLISPYFFRKITISILVGLARSAKGAALDNALANLNLVLPLLWGGIKDSERWAVGRAYAEAYDSGESTSSSGLKQALLKVKGFDFVPENLRSRTFIKAAEKLIEAHEGFDNFYNEPQPMRELRSLGSTVPIPAFDVCVTAILCVFLGNAHGRSNAAIPAASEMLDAISEDRWKYYFGKCLAAEPRVLNKLWYEKPRARFCELVDKYQLHALEVDGKIKRLLAAASAKDAKKISLAVEALRNDYYGKT